MSSITRLCLFVPFLLWCWLMMMVVHETGHVLGALATGGVVTEIVLQPFTISRTDVSPNPRPLAVTWAGPAIGTLVPLIAWAGAEITNMRFAHLARFFAGFCLIANGAYLAIGSFEAIGDAGKLLQYGSQVWQLILFGLIATSAGFWLWHGQGTKFGLGESNNQDSSADVYISIALFATTFVAMLFLG